METETETVPDVKFQALVAKLLQKYKDGQIMKAAKLLRSLERKLARSEGDEKAELEKIFQQNDLTFKSIRVEQREIEVLLDEFSIDEGWERIEVDKHGGRTLYKSNPGSPLQTIKMEGVIDASFLAILALIIEVDMYSTWIPKVMGLGLMAASEVASLTLLRKLAHFTVGCPWPVSDRDVCVYGYGADLLEDGIVMAVVRSHNVSPVIDKDYKTKEPKSGTKSDKQSSKKQQHPQHRNQMSSRPNDPPLEHCSIYDLLDEETKAKIPPETSKLVRVDVRIGGFLLKPMSPTRTHVSFLFDIDPKLTFLPGGLLNWGVKFIAHYAFSLLKTNAEDVHKETSPYCQRMKDKHELYTFLQSRMDDWVARQEKSRTSVGSGDDVSISESVGGDCESASQKESKKAKRKSRRPSKVPKPEPSLASSSASIEPEVPVDAPAAQPQTKPNPTAEAQ